MEVLYITKTSPLGDGGGGEERARKVTAGLADRGHDVTILCGKTAPSLATRSTVSGCTVRHVNCIPPFLFRFSTVSFYATRYLFALASLPILLWMLAIRDFDIAVENMTPYPTLSVLCTKLFQIPIVAVQHEFYDRSCYQTYDPVTASIQLLVQNILRTANYTAVVVPTTHVAEQLEAYGVDAVRIVVIPNGVDVEHYYRPDVKTNPYDLVTVGRLSKRKGQDLILRAFEQVVHETPNAHLHIVGKGPAQKEFEQLARRLEITDSVTFHGFVSDDRKVELLNQAGLFVFASRQEGFGLVLLEAMAAGLPVIATRLPVYRDFFEEHENGRLIDSRDAETFAQAIEEFLTDPHMSAQVAEANRDTATEFSWQRTVEKTDALLCDCSGS